MSLSIDKVTEHNKSHQRFKRPTNCIRFFVLFISCIFNLAFQGVYCIPIHSPQCLGWTFWLNIVCILWQIIQRLLSKWKTKIINDMKVRKHFLIRNHILNFKQAESFCKMYGIYYYTVYESPTLKETYNLYTLPQGVGVPVNQHTWNVHIFYSFWFLLVSASENECNFNFFLIITLFLVNQTYLTTWLRVVMVQIDVIKVKLPNLKIRAW